MNCPIFNQCKDFSLTHLSYLRSLNTPEAIVWGNADGTRNGHAWCSETVKKEETVDRLRSHYPSVLSQSFRDFEVLYDWAYDNLMKGIWVEARVLHYDIALRIAANQKDADTLLSSANVYLHAIPWQTANELDPSLKHGEYRKSYNYLDHIFDCGHCNPRIKEHALCYYHELFVDFAKTLSDGNK